MSARLYYTQIGTIIGEPVEVESDGLEFSLGPTTVTKLKNPAMIQPAEGGRMHILPLVLASAPDQLYEINERMCLFAGSFEPLPALAEAYRNMFGKVKVAPASALAGLQVTKR